MRKISFIILILFLSNISYSQFKEIPSSTKTKLKTGNLIFGFINPKNFSFKHSFNASVITSGNSTVSLTSYTGTISYKILDNMHLSADVTMQYSPFASIGSSNLISDNDFQNSLNGIFLSRVALDYQPSKNVFISLQYVNNKSNYFLQNYGYFNNWTGY